jgi:STE24 endopeptidase
VLPLIPILLVMTVLVADGGLLLPVTTGGEPTVGWVAAWAVGPTALTIVASAFVLWRTERGIARGFSSALRAANRIRSVALWLVLFNYMAAVLMLDWLGVVRSMIGDWLLIGELLVMVPPILGCICLWWSWYPIERRLHEAALLHRLDRGLPVHLPPERGPYVSTQLRVHVLMMLVPMLLILAASDGIELLMLDGGQGAPADITVTAVLTFAIALLIFLVSPWIARLVLGLRPIPAGAVRDDLQSICDRHGVTVRDIMLWRTRGTMVNAAVVGLVPWIRYVLLTDALLEQVPRPQVLAVMAHEVGHVRCRHMPTMLLALLALVVASELLVRSLVWSVPGLLPADGAFGEAARLALSLVVIIIGFGWVSRRIERQADTFAVRDLTMQQSEDGRATSDAVESMAGALECISSLHGVEPGRRSWRHGAIAWRCGYLRTLTGRAVTALPIDRTIRVLQIASVAMLLLGGVLYLDSVT